MPEVERVIKGLECCTQELGKNQHRDDFCQVCPYKNKDPDVWYCFAWHDLMRDALALLKAQEPRVMTLKELHECVTYWVEDETGHVVPETIMDITGKDIMTIPVVHLTNGYAPIITKTTDGYNSKRFTGWRCWTSRPTDEQREAVKWDG